MTVLTRVEYFSSLFISLQIILLNHPRWPSLQEFITQI
ncbi:hypothetical protein CRUP_016026 [Coryphaenoides rupestris]|nr:hypothetical protein CRUP_016026 [Coryphaenoides rupestris]